MAFESGLGKSRVEESGDVIENVINEGFDNDEMVVDSAPTQIPDLPPETKVLIIENDSPNFLRWGGVGHAWVPEGDQSDPKRGGSLPSGEKISVGLANHKARKIYLSAGSGNTAKVILLPGV